MNPIELPKVYEPKDVDQKWYQYWKEHNFFASDPHSNKPSFSIVLPPPNVTGVLHMGHALGSTLQDVLIRWKRMCGYEVLWMPGTDHAGIATQTVVEKHLIATEGKRRTDYSREDFLKRVWQWKEEKEARILGQLQRLGASCDWARCRFTMDEGCSLAVQSVFKKLFDQNLIYRDDYLVNWDSVTQTALADDEVEYEERSSFLWHLRYPLSDGSGYLVVATTRPETMLGDTAVAVSPKDPRYAHLIGKEICLPLTQRLIPIIADEWVDPEFGTGAVKVTPAHDPNDYQMGLRHQLPMLNIMTPDGLINNIAPAFRGMTMEEARHAVVKAISEQGLLERVEPHSHRVGLSYRSRAVIEPYLSKQWFVKMEPFKAILRQAVESGKVKLTPKNWENTYFHWIDNLRNWCISRQLWWGHRIPIWYNKQHPERIICHVGAGVPTEVEQNPNDWEQDPDVLDTWFSSGLWPFSSLGWPQDEQLLHKFYPNSVLVTGHDILFFWVARMLMMGKEIMGQYPFSEVFLSGLIYGKSYWRTAADGVVSYVPEEERLAYDLGQTKIPDDVKSQWEKMSKSKGNVIDPIELLDDYGTDAVRMTLCASSPQMRQIDLDRRRFEDFKNFANKIWNGARFVFMNLVSDESKNQTGLSGQDFQQGLNRDLLSLEDRWILSRFNRVVEEVNQALSQYAFDKAAMGAYEFFWKEFCAYYVEISKPTLFGKIGSKEDRQNKQKILALILCGAVRLLHPIAPFITEELFQLLKGHLQIVQDAKSNIDEYTKEACLALQARACIVAPYLQKAIDLSDISPEVEQNFALIDSIVHAMRNIRGEMQLPPSSAIDVYLVIAPSDTTHSVVMHGQSIICSLVRINSLQVVEVAPSLAFCSSAAVGAIQVIIPLPKEQQDQEKERLTKEQMRLSKLLVKINAQLSNAEFVANAPTAVVEKQRMQQTQWNEELTAIEKRLVAFFSA